MFGDAVRAHRLRLGFSQEALARAGSVGLRTVRDVEAGRIGRPRPSTVRLLADALALAGPERDRFHDAAFGASAPPPAVPRSAVPAQLPMDVPGFAGRDHELRRLTALLDANPAPTTVLVSAIAGTGGVGKTALAVRWAHLVADRFPDGQLYVNLRGYDPDRPMTAGEALARFLDALGVPSRDLPADVDDRAARYRTAIAGKRVLVVLDNASSVEQLRPLLPGSCTAVVLVTSRDSLAGLVAMHGAHRLELDLLPAGDARALLRQLLGARADAEPAAVGTLAELCARLPLALRVAAELAAARTGTPLAELADELAGQWPRLDLLDAGDDPRAAVAAVFSWSIRHLPAEVALAFALLGLHPGPDVDAYAAAALTSTDVAAARRTLERLARAHLVHQTSAGRYGMHDLLRAYAQSLVDTTEAGPALRRLLDYYVAATAAAMDALDPAEASQRPEDLPTSADLPELADPAAALRWLDTERAGLVAAAATAADRGWPVPAVRLAGALYHYLNAGHYGDALALQGYAYEAARQAEDVPGQAVGLYSLGTVYRQLRRYGTAIEHLERARALFRHAGDQAGEARAHTSLASVQRRLGRYGPAAEHAQLALALSREIGDASGEARALDNLGLIEGRLGRYEVAADHQREALRLFRLAGDRRGEAGALTNLGRMELRLGRYADAAVDEEAALALFRQVGSRRGEAAALDILGLVHTRLGRPDRAASNHKAALTIFTELGDPDGSAWALNGLGEAALRAGDTAEAITQHTAALDLATDIGGADQQARAHTGLGHAYRARGDLAGARSHYEHALRLHTGADATEADAVRAALWST